MKNVFMTLLASLSLSLPGLAQDLTIPVKNLDTSSETQSEKSGPWSPATVHALSSGAANAAGNIIGVPSIAAGVLVINLFNGDCLGLDCNPRVSVVSLGLIIGVPLITVGGGTLLGAYLGGHLLSDALIVGGVATTVMVAGALATTVIIGSGSSFELALVPLIVTPIVGVGATVVTSLLIDRSRKSDVE